MLSQDKRSSALQIYKYGYAYINKLKFPHFVSKNLYKYMISIRFIKNAQAANLADSHKSSHHK